LPLALCARALEKSSLAQMSATAKQAREAGVI